MQEGMLTVAQFLARNKYDGTPHNCVRFQDFVSVYINFVWQARKSCVTLWMKAARLSRTSSVGNLPGWRWARIKQLVLVGLSSSWHSEACNALGALSESPTAKFVSATISVRAAVNLYLSIEI